MLNFLANLHTPVKTGPSGSLLKEESGKAVGGGKKPKEEVKWQ